MDRVDPSDHPGFFRKIIEESVYTWCAVDDAMTLTYVSSGCIQLLGYRPDEMVGRPALAFIHPDDHERAVADLAELVAHPGHGVPVVIGLRHRDGATVFVEIGGQVHLDDPDIDAVVLRLRPYDDQQLLERYLEALATSVPVEETLLPLVGSIQAQHLTSQVALAYDWVDGVQRFASTVDTGLPPILAGAADHLADRRAGSTAGSTEGRGPEPNPRAVHPVAPSDAPPWVTAIRTEVPVIVSSIDQLPAPYRDAAAAAGLGSCWAYPVPVPPDGAFLACLIVWLEAAGEPMIGHGAALAHSVWLAALGFERRHSEQLLLHAALHDTLTGIPNRSHFFGELRSIEHPAPGDPARGHCAVLFADLDGFKDVNDTHGHGVGDQVLAVVARRLESAVRPGDVVARVGGDEFAVLCTDLDADHEATAVADRLIEAVSRPIAIGEVSAVVGLSIGVAFHDPAADVEGRLVDAADHALYQAKQSGKGRWVAAPRAG
jgi:diguanylate cyclase (GGDEF)-like protein/PAS domain S-box-containing protein